MHQDKELKELLEEAILNIDLEKVLNDWIKWELYYKPCFEKLEID